MQNPWIIMLICLAVIAVVLVALYFWGRKMQTKQADQRQQLEANAQNMNMLIIDKKRLKLKEAGLPKIVLEQTPKHLRGSKVPVVKAKIGPKITTLLCDEEIFDQIPVKAEVKARVSGLYIMSVNNFRNAPVEKPAKKGFMAKLRSKATQYTKQAETETIKAKGKNKK